MNYVFIASKAKDIIRSKGAIIDVIEGGPAAFISNVAKSKGIKFSLFSGSTYQVVEIDVKEEGEFGKVDKMAEIIVPPFEKNSNVLISTVSQEFDLNKLQDVSGVIALDIQGYVRGNDFGVKKRFENPTFLKRVTLLKGTKQELEFVDYSKVPIVVMTNGDKEGKIICKDNTFPILPKKTIVKNTIGAGDTFFSAFFISYVEKKDVALALKTALAQVEEFLQKK